MDVIGFRLFGNLAIAPAMICWIFVGTDPSKGLDQGAYLGFEGYLSYGRICVIGGMISSALKSYKSC